MSKYKPLADYLSQLAQDHVRLTFGEIERLAQLTLPKSAYKNNAWWANSRTRDSHGWAHLWLQAGWESCNLDLGAKTIEFRRAHSATSIASLYPTKLEFLMDLLVEAGTNVKGWSVRLDGSPVDSPRANPDYCYDWSFGSEDDGFYVLCLWCDLLNEPNGRVTYTENEQELARKLERDSRNPKLSAKEKARAIQQARRARAFDNALDFSYRRGLPIRVILNAGDIRSRDEIVESSSKVALRRLDPESWYVHRYFRDTGECLVVRGIPSDSDPEERRSDLDGSPGADDAKRLAAIKIRRGQAEFRQKLLAAYNRRCAVTGSAISDLLEAAHIIPHSEETNYRVTNGLLLRSDIHTLYDLHLMSVDERLRIHLSKTLQKSEYDHLQGQSLAVAPERFQDTPSPSGLSARHARFISAEKDRI